MPPTPTPLARPSRLALARRGLLGDQGPGLRVVPLRPRLPRREGSGPAFCGWEPEAIGQAAQPESALPPSCRSAAPQAAPPDPAPRPPPLAYRDIGELPGASPPPPFRVPGTVAAPTHLPLRAPGRDRSTQIALPGASPRREPPPRPLLPGFRRRREAGAEDGGSNTRRLNGKQEEGPRRELAREIGKGSLCPHPAPQCGCLAGSVASLLALSPTPGQFRLSL